MALNNRNYTFTDYDMVVAEKKAEEIAINMLKMNLDIKIISQATGLNVVEIENLKNSLK